MFFTPQANTLVGSWRQGDTPFADYAMTDAAVHDSQVFEVSLDEANSSRIRRPTPCTET